MTKWTVQTLPWSNASRCHHLPFNVSLTRQCRDYDILHQQRTVMTAPSTLQSVTAATHRYITHNVKNTRRSTVGCSSNVLQNKSVKCSLDTRQWQAGRDLLITAGLIMFRSWPMTWPMTCFCPVVYLEYAKRGGIGGLGMEIGSRCKAPVEVPKSWHILLMNA